MRRKLLALAVPFVLATVTSAAVTVLFPAHIPVLDPQAGVSVQRVIFRSAYSHPESTVHAAVWPYHVNTGPGEAEAGNVNLAHTLDIRLGVGELVAPEGERGALTLDLRSLRPLPQEVRRQWPELSRADVVRALLRAVRENLRLADIEACTLEVLGADEHEDLANVEFPAVLTAAPRPEERRDDRSRR